MVVALLFSALSLRAQDYGFDLRQSSALSDGQGANIEGPVIFSSAVTAFPWFAAPLGEKADLYLSGGISATLEDATWAPLPELLRCEFSYNPNQNMRLELGRVPFRESLSYIFSGLFDGALVRLNLGGGWLSVGAFYTGLLHKKRAYILMGEEDRADYYNRDVYFASRRLVLGINWEKTSIFQTRNTLALSALGQFDLNGGGTGVNTQYLAGRLDIPLENSFTVQTGGVFELIQQAETLTAAFALSADLHWLPPTPWRDAFALGGRFASGAWNEGIGAFLPIAGSAQGKALRPEFSGIAFAQSSYTARLHHTLSADLSAAYFFRTDETSYFHPNMDASSRSVLLGGEIYGALNWAPWSDLSVSLGGGVFFPQLGGYFKQDAGLAYRIALEAGFSF
jgi:hypothetical protein